MDEKEVFEIISKESLARADWMWALRTRIHRYPELGYEELQTSDIVASVLADLGIEMRRGIAGTGIVGLISGSAPGPVVALRADMDALPVTEKTGAPYASTRPGIMHACGHDGHTAMLLGAAAVLSSMKGILPGSLKLIFQPGEEAGGAAERMVSEGALADPNVQLIYGVHIWPTIESGKVAVPCGMCMASSTAVHITVKGRGGHCGMPHKSIDALTVANQIINMIQIIVSRLVDPVEPVVVNIGSVRAGERRNVIADEAEISASIRTFSNDTRDSIERWIEKIVASVSEVFGAEHRVQFIHLVPPLINDEYASDIARSAVKACVGPDSVEDRQRPEMTGEDFAFYLEHIPGALVLVGSRDEEKGFTELLHSPRMDFDSRPLAVGCQVLCSIAYRALASLNSGDGRLQGGHR